jgi:hypothetical protein
VKAEQGTLRVMAPCLEGDEVKVMRQVGESGTRSSHDRCHRGSLLAGSLDVCALLAPHPWEREKM